MKVVKVSELKVTNIAPFKEGINKFDVEVVTEHGAYRVPAQFAAPENSVAVILTREQAGNIRLCLEAVLEYDDFTALEELKNQIEEKLKNV